MLFGWVFNMRYKCTCSYDGTLFHGFQIQDKLRTVQSEIETALAKVVKKETIIFASGRTDALVHAIGQVFHFDSDIEMSGNQMKRAINSHLPKDIYIKDVEIVGEDFHSRFSAISKEYHYVISLGDFDPLKRNYVCHPSYKNIDYKRMEEASKIFVGEHDFKSFCKLGKNENTIRIIESIEFCYGNNQLVIKIVGNGFLHNMVRIIVGMLFEIGKGRIDINYLKEALDKKNRKYCTKVAPAEGLYLYKVNY